MALPFSPNSQMISPAMGATPQSVGTSAGTSTAMGSQGLPANYQEARNAFDQQQATNFPMGQPNLTVVGNDQFGQQFGYASQADAFDKFYNQNYANAPVGIVGGPVGSAPNFFNNQGMRLNQREYDLANPNTRNDLDYVDGTGVRAPSGLMGLVNQNTPNPVTNQANNPLSMANPNLTGNPLSITPPSAGVGAIAPNLGVTAGSAPGAGGLTQGTALPNITTTQQQATATPQFYLDYLNQIAKQGATSAQGAQYAGAQPLQQQAFGKVAENVGNYQPTLQNAVNLASSVGGTSLADAIGNLGNANIAYNLAPQATAGIVGSGQFGSARGAGALGQVLSNASLAITEQQQRALQQDMANRLAASQQLGNLASTTQNLGLGDVNALSTLGGQQQTIAQNEQLFPMQMLTQQANLLKGATIPTATSSSYTGPIPGAYNTSPLAQIAGIGSTLAGTGLGQSLFGSPATGGQPATQGLLGVGAKAATNWLGNQFNSMFGSTNLKTGEYPLADGGTMIVADDGSRKIIDKGGDVQEFSPEGNPIGSAPNEQALYDAEARAREEAYQQEMLDAYQNYYNYQPYDYFPNYEPPPPDYSYPNYEE